MKTPRHGQASPVSGQFRRILPAGACLLAVVTAASAVDDASWHAPAPAMAVAAPSAPTPGVPAPLVTGSLAPAIETGRIARGPSEADMAALARALAMHDAGKTAEADAQADAIGHKGAQLAAEWAALRGGGPAIQARRIIAFLDRNPDWPAMLPLRRRAEEALLAQRAAPAAVLAFFARFEPLTPAGRFVRAQALEETGESAAALAHIRALWRDETLSRAIEQRVLAGFGARLTARDHRDRMEALLFRQSHEAALKAAALAGPDHVKLAKARIALNRKSPGARALIEAVPASLHKDSSYLFARAQMHRRADEAEKAAALLAAAPADPDMLADGDEWWVERRLVARQLLDKGLAKTAYEVAAGHRAEKATASIEAEWHAGWIALRHLHDARMAQVHFDRAASLAETPISTARAAYWQGRAAEALGEIGGADQHYRRAARHPAAYYGQIARARLGLKSTPLRSIAPAAPQSSPALQTFELLERAGARELARTLALDLGRHLDDAPTLARIAEIAEGWGDARFLVSFGKLAIHRGLPLDLTAFPTAGMPGFELPSHRVERAMVFAIARQESAFDAGAVSHAGARGLMQMMPPTARETARRFGLSFDAGRLTSDPAYNARLGAAHLADLLRDWRGSYILAFAAYNAGSGNVKDWIEAYGDPRDPAVDPIDWVERIPFTETRHYVQRVLENLQVYRALVDEEPLLLMARDLRRGLNAHRFAGEGGQAMPGPKVMARSEP